MGDDGFAMFYCQIRTMQMPSQAYDWRQPAAYKWHGWDLYKNTFAGDNE